MKIFDFTDGRKGKLLDASAAYCHRTGGWLVKKGDTTYRVKLADRGKRGTDWSWHTDAGDRNDNPISPETYGVGAICFCTGEFAMSGSTVWQWHVIGTTDWNREACRKGILKAEKFIPEAVA